MRAIALHKTGDIPELMDLPVPRPAAGEIMVRLEAASLNPIDVGIAAGYFEGRMPHVYPLVLGVDGAGRVTEVGEGVSAFEPGDLVHGQFLSAPLGRGTFAEYTVVSAFPDGGALLRVPDGVSAELAAALPTAGMTAIGALDTIDPGPGRSILIVGATGGVGVFAVQLAAMHGAEVIATARPEADAWIRGLGATHTVDYTAASASVAEQVRMTHPDGVDAVLDLTRDPAQFAANAGLVHDGGTALSVAIVATPELLASERITVVNFMMHNKPDLLARITAEVASGRITAPIQRTITLDQVPAALAATASGVRGKTTIRI